MKRTLVVGVLLAATLACQGKDETPPAPPAQKIVGVTLLSQTQDFYKDLEAGLREEALARGLTLIVTACEMDPVRQASQIEDLVSQRVAAIVAAPCDSAAIGPSLARPEEAGIPVFTTDISAASGKVVAHVASDNVQGGRLAARALVKYMGETGKILIIDHPTVASVQDRVRGFLEELKPYTGIKVAARLSSDGQRAKAMSIMEDMLQTHRDLKGVFGINDDSALGATAVLLAAGRKDVVVVGYDATPPAQEAIRSGGPLKADVIQHPRLIGRTTMEAVARYLAGEAVPPLVAVEVGLFEAPPTAR